MLGQDLVGVDALRLQHGWHRVRWGWRCQPWGRFTSGHDGGTRYSPRHCAWCTGMYWRSCGAAALPSRGANTNANPFVSGLTDMCDEPASWSCLPLPTPLSKKTMKARFFLSQAKERMWTGVGGQVNEAGWDAHLQLKRTRSCGPEVGERH